MPALTYLTLDKEIRQRRQPEVDALAMRISGGLLKAAHSGYDEPRKIWNATVDRRPALIARCLNQADDQFAVRFAGEHRMLVSVRGGGNFGVVTSFESQLQPVGPQIYSALIVYPFAQAQQVLRAWRDFTTVAPDELRVWASCARRRPSRSWPTRCMEPRSWSSRSPTAGTSLRVSALPRRCSGSEHLSAARPGPRLAQGSSLRSIRCFQQAVATTGRPTISSAAPIRRSTWRSNRRINCLGPSARSSSRNSAAPWEHRQRNRSLRHECH
jgi:hypothetical protein